MPCTPQGFFMTGPAKKVPPVDASKQTSPPIIPPPSQIQSSQPRAPGPVGKTDKPQKRDDEASFPIMVSDRGLKEITVPVSVRKSLNSQPGEVYTVIIRRKFRPEDEIRYQD
jgi:hypothetical protein